MDDRIRKIMGREYQGDFDRFTGDLASAFGALIGSKITGFKLTFTDQYDDNILHSVTLELDGSMYLTFYADYHMTMGANIHKNDLPL